VHKEASQYERSFGGNKIENLIFLIPLVKPRINNTERYIYRDIRITYINTVEFDKLRTVRY
jgi:hypothetical protein